MRIRIHALHALGIAITLLAMSSAASAQSAGQKQKLTIEQLIDIKHPSNPIWSPDGKLVAFVWDRAGVANLYIANADGSGQPKPLTSFPQGQVDGAFWNADGDIVYFPHDGDLWQVATTGGAPKAVWSKPDPGSGYVPSPDGKRVAFVRSKHAAGDDGPHPSDLIIRWLSDGTESTTAHNDVSIHGILWSPDGLSLAYVGGAKIIHHDESPSYSGEKIIYRVSEYVPGQIYALKLADAKPVPVAKPGEYGGLAWLDNTHLVFDGQSPDSRTISFTSRTPLLASQNPSTKFTKKNSGASRTGAKRRQPWPSPNGKWIAFLSDEDGWDHLYVMPASGGAAVQITKGKFEAWRPAWSHDSTRIAFDANLEDHPGDRVLGIAKIGDDPAHAEVTYIPATPGTNIEPHWSEGDGRLVYQHTDTRNSADLYTIGTNSGAAPPVRLTDSMPTGMDRSQFVEPQFVHFPGPDGQQVPGWLFFRRISTNRKSIPPSCGFTATA